MKDKKWIALSIIVIGIGIFLILAINDNHTDWQPEKDMKSNTNADMGFAGLPKGDALLIDVKGTTDLRICDETTEFNCTPYTFKDTDSHIRYEVKSDRSSLLVVFENTTSNKFNAHVQIESEINKPVDYKSLILPLIIVGCGIGLLITLVRSQKSSDKIQNTRDVK